MSRTARKYGLALVLVLWLQPASAETGLSKLDGEWVSDCVSIGKGGRHGTIVRLAIRNGSLQADAQLYARNTCQQPTVRSVFAGDLTSGGSSDNPHLQIDMVVGKMLTTANAVDVVAHYNMPTKDQAGCGLTNWELNVPKSTAGLKCGAFQWPASGAKMYESVWISGNELRFGALPFIWNNTSPEARPERPSEVIFYRTGF
ncbi:hypothetical protein [Terrihabitans sp. B22-R8]|uniref:hypothetical protein n=1 Tax=Terrihabitans sp. B22-R8 TaxID=3425128 RepID=UPI00403C5F76